MKNSKVWEVSDTSSVLGRILSATAQEALKLAREFWRHADVIKVRLVKGSRR